MLYLFVPSVGKKSLFFYQKSNATHLNIFFAGNISMAEAQQTADSAAQQPVVSAAQQPVDITQQVTSKTPVIKQKNPKRVAAGKLIAERTRLSREAQKKKAAEAEVIIANNQLKKAEAAAAAAPPAVAPPAAAPPADESQPAKNVLTTTQWLSVIGIFISFASLYYKREEINKLLIKKPPQTPPPSPVDAAPQRKGGIGSMD